MRRESLAECDQGPPQSDIGNGECLVPTEPTNTLTLARRRAWLDVGGDQQVTQVEMGVVSSPGMHIDMDEFGPGVRMLRVEARLLCRFPAGSIPWRFVRIDVSARLKPDSQPLVQVQNDTAGSDDKSRSGDMNGTCGLVERSVQGVE